MKIFWVSLLLLLYPVIALAAPIEINVPGVGNKPVQGDIDGTAYWTERYPPQLQFSYITLASAPSVATNDSVTTISVPNGLYGTKTLKISLATVNGVKAWTIKLLGSYDGINYGVIMDSKATVGASSNAVTVTSDTLRFVSSQISSNGIQGATFINLCYSNGNPIIFPFIQVRFYNNLGAAVALLPTIEVGSRLQ